MAQDYFRWLSHGRLVVLLWAAAIIAAATMAYTGPAGWDAQIYWRALQNLRHAEDPYAVGIAAQIAFRNRPVSSPVEHVPFTYVYSPMTLPLLSALTSVPGWLLGLLYGLAVSAGFLLQLWAGFQMAEKRERPWLALMLPAVAFFPGLVTDDTILSGNIGYVLYGVILATAVSGWKRGRWFWYYVAVLAASIVKAPLLNLLAFPILVGKRQWLPAGGTAAAGLALFAVQAKIWPEQFREYLVAIRLMFDIVHDFGFGPGGSIGRGLWRAGRPYSSASIVAYLVSSLVVGVVLLILRRRVRLGQMTQEEWIPVAMVGTLLFYPRIMRYDLAAFSIPMLLIAWRTFRKTAEFSAPATSGKLFPRLNRETAIVPVFFLATNVLTVTGPMWVPVELMALLAIFALGVWSAYQPQWLGRRSDVLSDAGALAGQLSDQHLPGPPMRVTFDVE